MKIRNGLLIVLGLLAIFASVLCFNLAFSRTVPYTFFYYRNQTTYILAFIVLPAALVTLFFPMIKMRKISKPYGTVITVFVALALLFAANGIACAGAVGVGMRTLLEHYDQLDSQRIGDNLYVIDFINHLGVGGDDTNLFVFWKCDSLGWECNILYRQDYDESIPQQAEMSGRLVTDPAQQTITVYANGKDIYTYTIGASPQ